MIFFSLLLVVQFAYSQELLFKVIEDAPAWNRPQHRNDNYSIIIPKGEIVRGVDIVRTSIDDQSAYVTFIIYNNQRYSVRSEMLVPAFTEDLFDDSWISSIYDHETTNQQFFWVLDYYLTVLQSGNRETLRNFEHKWIDDHIEEQMYTEYPDPDWYIVKMYRYISLEVGQMFLSITGGMSNFHFMINNIRKFNSSYIVSVTNITSDFAYSNSLLHSRSTVPFPHPLETISYDLVFIRDNDYMDMYLNTTENYLATFVNVEWHIIELLNNLMEYNTVDLSKITLLPRRAPKQLNAGEECRVLENLRLRESPNTQSSIITTMERGRIVTILEIGPNEEINGVTSPWVKVQTDNGQIGWCFGLYLRETRFEPMAEELIILTEYNEETVLEAPKEEETTVTEQNSLPFLVMGSGALVLGIILSAVLFYFFYRKSRKLEQNIR